MSTLVCFHAHPDDEAITTGGLMAKAAAAGHKVVLVCATRGEQGEPQEGVLNHGEALWERRIVETAASCEALGAEPPIFLGYEDSGMMDEPTNANPKCFWQADVQQASEGLAAILREHGTDVLTIYDDHGGYGHPDHIQVHRVGKRAAELAGIANVFEASINRDAMRSMMEQMPEDEDRPSPDEVESFGTAAADLRYEIDVTSFVDQKRASMTAHRSQIGPDSFFFKMPDEIFSIAFGTESFAVPGLKDTGGPENVDLLPGL